MKTNELKATDLMIGDWLKHYNGTPMQVTKITTEHFACAENRGMNCWEYNNKYEPIPLTPEILEKNGFEKVDNMYPFPTFRSDDKENYLCITVGFPEGDRTKRKFPFIEIDSKDIYVEHVIINFVHELQHALRLCGINKEIEL